MVPPYIRVLFEECVGIVLEPLGIATEDLHVEQNVPLEPILSQSVNNERKPLQLSRTTFRSNIRIQDTPLEELRQFNISEGFNASTKQHLDSVWAIAFYKANIPFNVMRHLAFVYAMLETTCYSLSDVSLQTTIVQCNPYNIVSCEEEKSRQIGEGEAREFYRRIWYYTLL